MHNCKATRERVAELLLSGSDYRPDELLVCEDCCREFDALKATLRVTLRLMEKATPPPTYWTGYHARLRDKLTTASSRLVDERKPSWFVRVMTASVRVPVPVGVALVLVFGALLFFMPRVVEKRFSPPAVAVQVPVEVPVIQERIVTRIVYRRAKSQAVAPVSDQRFDGSTLARSQRISPVSLIGFKPLDEIKMTVIKGGSPDEK
jgi:hypothetical protein